MAVYFRFGQFNRLPYSILRFDIHAFTALDGGHDGASARFSNLARLYVTLVAAKSGSRAKGLRM